MGRGFLLSHFCQWCWNKMKINNIQRLIEEYDTEKIIFTEIGPRARKNCVLNFDDFYKICMWKSRRQKNRYLKNKNKVENISRKAFLTSDETKKIELLCGLDGVGIPTASAILTVLYPENYSIIDIRCIETLNHLGYKMKNVMTVNNWLKYLEIMRDLAKENNVTTRDLDKALFALHRRILDEKGFVNLYGRKP